MGNETDTPGVISRKQIFKQGDFKVDVDSTGRFFFYAPDGTQEKGLTYDGVGQLQDAINSVTFYVHHKKDAEQQKEKDKARVELFRKESGK